MKRCVMSRKHDKHRWGDDGRWRWELCDVRRSMQSKLEPGSVGAKLQTRKDPMTCLSYARLGDNKSTFAEFRVQYTFCLFLLRPSYKKLLSHPAILVPPALKQQRCPGAQQMCSALGHTLVESYDAITLSSPAVEKCSWMSCSGTWMRPSYSRGNWCGTPDGPAMGAPPPPLASKPPTTVLIPLRKGKL